MIGKKILDRKEVTLREVAEILSSTDEELGFEQAKTLEYAKKMAKLDAEKEKKMIEELMAEIEKIDRAKAVKIVDLLPRTEDEVKEIFAKEIYTLNDEEVKKVLEIVGKYV